MDARKHCEASIKVKALNVLILLGFRLQSDSLIDKDENSGCVIYKNCLSKPISGRPNFSNNLLNFVCFTLSQLGEVRYILGLVADSEEAV